MSSFGDPGGIFISYRREETSGQAGRLYDRLREQFGEDFVFMDVDSIEIGADFPRAVIEAMSRCNILLVLIGRNWLAITDSEGRRRIDNPDDWVRLEIETILQRDVRVIPVLLDGAILPRADDLPRSLQPLIRRQAFALSHSNFRSEVTRLLAAIDQVPGTGPGGSDSKERSEARRRTNEAIEQYVLLQDATTNQRNILIDRMRREAPQARYSAEEISDFLQDRINEARRYAGLASIQWHWPNRDRQAVADYPFQEITPVCREEQRSTEYFPQLLDLLCKPARKFEHYHVIYTAWGMSSHLRPEQMLQLCERVCDGVDCQPLKEHQSEHWSSFVEYVKGTCAKRSGEREHHA
jgi:hypothetical protein